MARRFVFVVLLVLFYGTGLTSAQDPRGTILGRVTDPSGAVIPGVTVQAINIDTGVSTSAVTNDSGNYTIPFLLPGTYQVIAELPGFKRTVRSGIQVRVSDNVEVNLQLEIGEVTESVEVVSPTPQLDTVGTSLGQVIDERRVRELPLLAGNPTELALLSPGVVNATNLRLRKPAFNNGLSQIATDGNQVKSNEFQIDGISNTFAEGGGNSRVAFSPPVEAVQQIKIQTSPYDASVGHTIGSLINVSTASGTNELHGEVHYWARNSAFDAPNFFNNKRNTEVPVYQDHRYGASAGGPFYIPGLYDGRNKTFWYYAYEGNKWGVPVTSTSTVPTAAQRQGDFSALLALGDQYQIYDPATIEPAEDGRFSRQPFPNNIIPQHRLDPLATRLLDIYPMPNQPGTSDGRNNFFHAYKALEDYYVHFARVDHVFSERHRMFVRVHYDWWEEDKNDNLGTNINGIFLNRINRGAAIDNVFVLSPSFIFNLRYGITSQDFLERRRSAGADLTALGFSQNLLSLLPDPENAPIPRITLSPYAQISNWESGDGANTSLTHTVTSNFTRLLGDHNFKFGAELRVYRGFGSRIPRGIVPDLEFNEQYTRGPFDNSSNAPIGQELAALLLGIPDGVMEVSATSAIQDKYLAFYFHDDFKVTNRLTLNLGLRYEYESPITERFDRLVSGFAFDTPNPIEEQARANYAANPIPELPPEDFRVLGGLTFVGHDGLGRNPYNGETNNFLPRIGIAYQLTPNTVLRTGYGIFFDTIGVNGTRAIQTGFSQTTPIQASLNNGLTFLASTADPFPNGLVQPLGADGGLMTNLGQGLSFYFRNRKNPYSQRWSFGLQHLLPGEFMVEGTYVGNRSTRLGVVRELNAIPAQYLSTTGTRDQETIDFLTEQFPNPFFGLNPVYSERISRGDLLRPYPHFGSIQTEEPIGYAWYHAFQGRVEKRFSQGYTFTLGYTWSKLMEAVEFLNTTDPTPYESIASMDRPHRLTMSGIWEIPVGHGRRYGSSLPAFLNGVLGGWQISGVATYQSGAPLGFGNAIFNGDIKDIPLASDQQDVDRWFNTEAGFNRNPSEQLAFNIRTFPLRFNGVRADSQHRWDFSLRKNFPIHEEVTLQFRAEVYNAWNMTSFNAPSTSVTSSAFGQITGTAADARNWQFALKLEF